MATVWVHIPHFFPGYFLGVVETILDLFPVRAFLWPQLVASRQAEDDKEKKRSKDDKASDRPGGGFGNCFGWFGRSEVHPGKGERSQKTRTS